MTLKLSSWHYLPLYVLLLAGLTACKRGDARAEVEATAAPTAVVESEVTDERPERAESEETEEEADARRAARARAEQDRARFIDPELVRAVQARSGLIDAPPPELRRLLHRADLRDVLRYTGPLKEVELPGQEVSSSYNAIRYAMGQDLGCSLQRWDFISRSELDLRYDQYVETLFEPVKEARTDAATHYSTFAGVRLVVMKLSAQRAMVQLACTESLLSEPQLRELSERVSARL